jgi:hypothetical protein
MKVKLSELEMAVESDMDETHQFVNMATGEVVFFTDEELNAVEEDASLDDYPEWQHEVIEEARKVIEAEVGEFVHAPSQYDFHEYAVMEDFCYSLEDEAASNQLLDLIRGRGAFRRFKDGVYTLGIEDEWHSFRDDALKKYLVDWCEEQGIEYVDDFRD